MNENNNRGKSFDFSPDLENPKENLKKKTTITVDEEVAQFLERKRLAGVNVSAFINKLLQERAEIESALRLDKYGFMPAGFVQVPLLLHKEMADFLNLLEMQVGAIPIANKIAELLAQDSCGFLAGDCNVYGCFENLPKSLARLARAFKQLSEKDDR